MSLNVTYDQGNIFAKIVQGDMPSVKIYEDDNVLSFMDVFPQSEGHALVIHKKAQAVNLFDMDADALSTLTAAVQKVAAAVKDGLKPDGLRIAQFNGEAAGQTVFHTHFHIIPVYADKSLGAHASGGPLGADVLEPLAAKIRAAL